MTLFQAVVVTVLGVATLFVGLYGVFRPYTVALWTKRIDTIGSNVSWNEIEPTDWYVSLTRLSFLVLTIGGIIFLLMALPEWLEVL